MVTIMVGKINAGSDVADVRTLCDGADLPHRTTIDLCNIKPGKPK